MTLAAERINEASPLWGISRPGGRVTGFKNGRMAFFGKIAKILPLYRTHGDNNGRATQSNHGRLYRQPHNRMWLSDDAPRNSESRAISYALKYIKRACPSVAWVQSFADERCKGLGVVYQACSFLYVGCHTTEFYELDGQTYHKMLLTAHLKTGQRGEHLRNNLHRATKHSLRQFRYVRFLKTDWQRRLRLPILPYPKPETECQK